MSWTCGPKYMTSSEGWYFLHMKKESGLDSVGNASLSIGTLAKPNMRSFRKETRAVRMSYINPYEREKKKIVFSI
jgi:hypothetical protein